ncbi:hypothetical protein [Mangrovibacter plantisponsor]|uniref:hypothetical protein n=1 Tax=Mangrovibacter plantisponsor TaxID=451513 RepID=UPI001475D03C|nr:hypothetical protein [Mangrovibacter plantisponsor]
MFDAYRHHFSRLAGESFCGFDSFIVEDDIEASICGPEERTISTPSTVNTLNSRSILALAVAKSGSCTLKIAPVSQWSITARNTA